MNSLKLWLLIVGVVVCFTLFGQLMKRQMYEASTGVATESKELIKSNDGTTAACIATILGKLIPTKNRKVSYQYIFENVYKGLGYTVCEAACTPETPILPLFHGKQCGNIFQSWLNNTLQAKYNPPIKNIPSKLRSAFLLKGLIQSTQQYRNDFHNAAAIAPLRWTHELVKSFLHIVQSNKWGKFPYGKDTGKSCGRNSRKNLVVFFTFLLT